MQCPSCEHEAPQAEFGEPLRCPACSSYYTKALAAKQKAAVGQAREINASKKRGFKLVADHVEVATRGLDGVQPVVVVDVQMRFMSMVRFMVMWALASIPAAFVVVFILYGLFRLLGIID